MRCTNNNNNHHNNDKQRKKNPLSYDREKRGGKLKKNQLSMCRRWKTEWRIEKEKYVEENLLVCDLPTEIFKMIFGMKIVRFFVNF